MNVEPVTFTDTNVLVYAFDASHPEHQAIAEKALLALMSSDRLRLSTQVLQEFFVTMSQKVAKSWPRERLLAALDDFAIWPTLVIEPPIIREAAELAGEAQLSFWDALIVTAAARSGAAILLSEDLNHGQVVRGVRIVNPFIDLAEG